MTPIDHARRGSVVHLRRFVSDMRRLAENADWRGDTATARAYEREAEDAIRAGQDPVPMF